MPLTQTWDKLFPQSNKVDHRKVTFKNRYGITLAADLYVPKNSSGKLAAIGPVMNELKGGEAQFLVDYHDFYRTPRGFHPRSVNSNGSWTLTTPLSFMNMPILSYIKEISPRPILFVHGEKAHSRYFSETAYAAAAQPKELMIIPGASHTDLYDRLDLIPFAKFTAFFQQHLK